MKRIFIFNTILAVLMFICTCLQIFVLGGTWGTFFCVLVLSMAIVMATSDYYRMKYKGNRKQIQVSGDNSVQIQINNDRES